MKLFYASEIEWDADGGDATDLGLPYYAHVFAEEESDVVDVLSDELGYCISTLNITEVLNPMVLSG